VGQLGVVFGTGTNNVGCLLRIFSKWKDLIQLDSIFSVYGGGQVLGRRFQTFLPVDQWELSLGLRRVVWGVWSYISTVEGFNFD